MTIKVAIDIIPSEDRYGLRFLFEDFTEEERFFFNKYGFISVLLPIDVEAVDMESGIQGWLGEPRKMGLDVLHDYKFLFGDKQTLNDFKEDILKSVQSSLEKYLSELREHVGEELYHSTATGEIKKINEGAKKALDRNSKEYKEIIEKNREAFEKLSKL